MTDTIIMTPSGVHAVADSVAGTVGMANDAAAAVSGGASLSSPGFRFGPALAAHMGKFAGAAHALAGQVENLAANLHGAATDIQDNEGRGKEHVDTLREHFANNPPEAYHDA